MLLEIEDNDENEVVALLRSMKHFATGGPPSIYITEILSPNDRRGYTPAFEAAAFKEMKGLTDCSALKILLETMFQYAQMF